MDAYLQVRKAMVYYNTLNIIRVVMHKIIPKRMGVDEHVEIEATDHLVELDNNIKDIIKKRLIDSCGRQGKSFLLGINNVEEGSCFSLVKNLGSMPDADFLRQSVAIAELLASAQDKRNSIPGGYFILVDARKPDGLPVYIILKAEKQDALSEAENSVRAVQNIFLSPAQKMYKAGIFEQTGVADELTQAHFKAYLFDSQFNNGTRLAEYFYKEFLGLTIEGNCELETKMFYDTFSSTIATVYKNDVETRNECFNLLQAEMNNQERSIDPSEVIRRIVPEGQRDEFISKVGNRFPNPFLKDRQLLQRKLSNKSMYLTSSIRILAPAISFDNNIITISDDENDPTIKIVRIRTQAVNNEEH